MLRAILNKSWRQHPTRHQLYGHLPPITKTIQARRARHAGHCWRSRDELISDVLLWTPTYGRAKAGQPARTYIQQLREDMGCSPADLPEAMNDREKWRERVKDISVRTNHSRDENRRGILLGDLLLRLLFLIAMMPLNYILWKCRRGIKFAKSKEKINHLMYMDDIKTFARNKKGQATSIRTIRTYSQDIEIEFGIEKFAMLKMKSRKRENTEGIELPIELPIERLGKRKNITSTWKY